MKPETLNPKRETKPQATWPARPDDAARDRKGAFWGLGSGVWGLGFGV